MSKIPKTFSQVKTLVEKFPVLADSDSRLCVNFWIDEIKEQGLDLGAMKATELLTLIKDEKLTSFDTITRNRRILEEDFPALRGKTYERRQKHKQQEVKTEIKTMHTMLENYQKLPIQNIPTDLFGTSSKNQFND